MPCAHEVFGAAGVPGLLGLTPAGVLTDAPACCGGVPASPPSAGVATPPSAGVADTEVEPVGAPNSAQADMSALFRRSVDVSSANLPCAFLIVRKPNREQASGVSPQVLIIFDCAWVRGIRDQQGTAQQRGSQTTAFKRTRTRTHTHTKTNTRWYARQVRVRDTPFFPIFRLTSGMIHAARSQEPRAQARLESGIDGVVLPDGLDLIHLPVVYRQDVLWYPPRQQLFQHANIARHDKRYRKKGKVSRRINAHCPGPYTPRVHRLCIETPAPFLAQSSTSAAESIVSLPEIHCSNHGTR